MNYVSSIFADTDFADLYVLIASKLGPFPQMYYPIYLPPSSLILDCSPTVRGQSLPLKEIKHLGNPKTKPNLQFSADLVTFTEEILNRKNLSFCAVMKKIST